MLAIVRDPLYKKWGAALRAYERAMEKLARGEIEQVALNKARDKAMDAYNWLRALPLTTGEGDAEYERLRAISSQFETAQAAAAAMRQTARLVELEAIDRAERDDPHTRYVPGVGYARGKRLLG